MSSILIRTAVVVLLLAVLGFGTGLAFGAIWGWSFFSLGLVGLLLHHVRHLNLLRRWASSSLTEAVPEGSGAWEEVFTLLYRRQRAETARSRQLAHSLARSRQAGRALPYGVAILDDEYRIVWCNDSCEAGSPSSSMPWRGTRRPSRSRACRERAAASPRSFPRAAWCRRACARRPSSPPDQGTRAGAASARRDRR